MLRKYTENNNKYNQCQSVDISTSIRYRDDLNNYRKSTNRRN